VKSDQKPAHLMQAGHLFVKFLLVFQQGNLIPSITNIEEPLESARFFAKNALGQCLQKLDGF
jgi:hypothetical protein